MVPELPDDAVPMEEGFEEDATDAAARRKAEAAAKLEAEMLLRSRVRYRRKWGSTSTLCTVCKNMSHIPRVEFNLPKVKGGNWRGEVRSNKSGKYFDPRTIFNHHEIWNSITCIAC